MSRYDKQYYLGLCPLEVTARSSESAERMIKRFMKKVRSDGVLKEVIDRRFYDKPSITRRKKAAKARWERNKTSP